MSNVIYKHPDGSKDVVDVPDDENLMRGAVDNGIDGIVGECGGGLACATCHCYVDEAWAGKLDAPCQDELDMLESTAAERRPNSRLSCQIVMNPALDGIVIELPETQF